MLTLAFSTYQVQQNSQREERIKKQPQNPTQAFTSCQSKTSCFHIDHQETLRESDSFLRAQARVRAETPHLPHSEPHLTCGVKDNRLAISVGIPVAFKHLASFDDVVLGSVCFWSSHQKKYPAVKRRNKLKVSKTLGTDVVTL